MKAPPLLTLDSAVDAQELAREIKRAVDSIRLNYLHRNGQIYQLDASRFVVNRPLIITQLDFFRLHRSALDSIKGGGCVPLVIRFLMGHQNEADISILGLAPNQVEEHLTEETLEYFQEAEKLVLATSGGEKTVLISFKAKYPRICERLSELRVQNRGENWRAISRDPYQEIRERLKEQVIGQDGAVETLASLLAAHRGDETSNRSFLFVGPSGVGKTELAHAIAKIKSIRGEKFVTFECQLYNTEYDVKTFFGSSSGLVGSNDRPLIVKKLQVCSPTLVGNVNDNEEYNVEDVVLLFDEFEKSDASFKQSFLTLFDKDKGYFEVSYNRRDLPVAVNVVARYKFRKSIFIATSNLYQREILDAFSRGESSKAIADSFKTWNVVRREINSYSPELLNRFSVSLISFFLELIWIGF